MVGRAISWIKAAQKDFLTFPRTVQEQGLQALAIAAEGSKADIAKPLKGFDSGVLELVLNDRAGTYRVIYAIKVGDDLWVLHAFKKKSKSGIKTPKHELDLVKDRLRWLKEMYT